MATVTGKIHRIQAQGNYLQPEKVLTAPSRNLTTLFMTTQAAREKECLLLAHGDSLSEREHPSLGTLAGVDEVGDIHKLHATSKHSTQLSMHCPISVKNKHGEGRLRHHQRQDEFKFSLTVASRTHGGGRWLLWLFFRLCGSLGLFTP
jgi:hypothetical protein